MDPAERSVADALAEERAYVLAMGGFALELAGGTLVTNERVPVPRFNFVQEVRAGRERQTAFFEKALDHYFQRALRPTFRLIEPAAPHLLATLAALGFRPRPQPLTLLLAAAPASPAPVPGPQPRSARPEELDLLVGFWADERERDELRRAIDVVWNHPDPGETLLPLLLEDGDRPVAAALLYRRGPTAGLHGVATQPTARGRGHASALVAGALRALGADAPEHWAIWDDSGRLARRLAPLGFRPAARWRVFELPRDAQLAIPPPGPPGPHRWRPPRRVRPD